MIRVLYHFARCINLSQVFCDELHIDRIDNVERIWKLILEIFQGDDDQDFYEEFSQATMQQKLNNWFMLIESKYAPKTEGIEMYLQADFFGFE